MSFNAREDTISEMFNRKIYSIPRNQRAYVWNKNNWLELYTDVAYRLTNPSYSHFIGSIVLKSNDKKKGLLNFTIIDGQQRVMTLSIFLVSIMFWMRKLHMDSDFEGTKPYVVAMNDKAQEMAILNSESNRSYEMIVDKLIIEKVDVENQSSTNFVDKYGLRNDKNISNAFIFFTGEIEKTIKTEGNEADKEKLIELRNAVREITYVNITASTEEDSYTIFEILNARGIDLEDHELLKNYIMRYIQPEADRDDAKNAWMQIVHKLNYVNLKNFVRHYTTHRYGEQRNRSSHLSDYKIIQKNNLGKNTKDLLNDLEVKSDYYLMLCAPSDSDEDKNCNPMEYRIFSFFKKKRQQQLRPLLLSMITKHKDGSMNSQLYERSIEFLYNFYVCYNIIGQENSNKLTGTVNKYASKIYNDYSDEVITEFVEEFKKKLPTRVQFINAFKTIGWTHHNGIYEGEKNKRKVQTVLEILERQVNHDRFLENMTIEHVYPDNKDPENGQIGNLIPLEDELNQRCQNRELADKLTYYEDSNYKTARAFARRYRKQEFDPSVRTIKLAEFVYDHVLNLNY